MYTCYVCRFAVELDDTVTATARGNCICLRCYLRHTDGYKPLPKELRRELTTVLAEA